MLSRSTGESRGLAAAVLALALVLFPAIPSPSAAAEKGSLRVTHVDNEGFLLEAGGRKVLVDGLFGRNPTYIDLDASVRSRVENARGAFAGVDLILASHYHADHFDAGAVSRHLQANPEAVFVSTPQAVAQLRKRPEFEGLRERVRAVYPKENRRERLPELGLEVLNLHHGRNRRPLVENLGLVIHLGGFKVLHVGDTEVTREELEASGLGKDGIDLALIPDWLLVHPPWKGMVEAVVSPRHLVAAHLRAGYGAEDFARIEKASPGALILRKPLETRTFRRAAE